MKITGINSQLGSQRNQQQVKKNQNPGFKSSMIMPILGGTGTAMNWIEKQGYLISFLIQDGLGMTLPRVLTGFNRDKEITGTYNVQEGLEVLGREAMTGPYIIGVAPAVLAVTGLFCRTTNTNTRLIKRLSESFKKMVNDPKFDKTVMKDADKFKQEFYKYHVSSIYKESVPGDKNPEETVNYILEEMKLVEPHHKKKIKDAALGRIQARINSKMVETTPELYKVNTLMVGDEKTKLAFNSGEVITAIRDYGKDAIDRNKQRESIDEKAIDNMKNSFATKRFLTNIANVVLTLGGLALIPKLYVRGDVAPGAKLHAQKNAQTAHKDNHNDGNTSPAFKAKGINNDGPLTRMGRFLLKHTPEKVQALLEYTGYNFSKTTFALLATFGLLGPRGLKAWERAQVDENGKKDMTELNEILLRDTVSSLSVVFAVPMMTKAIVRSYENKMGFVLTNRASDGKSWYKKLGDILWPYSNLEVLSVADLDAIYSNIDSKSKLLNFSKFVSEKGGDLQKIIAKSENASLMFNDKTFTLDSIKNLTKEEKNKKIVDFFEKFNGSNDVISKVMKGTGDIKHNNIAKMARGLNSLPGFISTVILSPVLLGVLIPKLTYYNTRKAYEKKHQQKMAAN